MQRYSLEQLLDEADTLAPRIIPADQLAERVLLVARRRSRNQVVAMVAVVLLAGLSPMLYQRSRGPAGGGRQSLAASAALESQIAAQEQSVQRLIRAEQMARDQARLEAISRLPTGRDVTERAASEMVRQADRLIKTVGLDGPALQTYDDVINYFPDTPSADIARRRVAELRKVG